MQTTKGEIMMGLIFPIEKITLKELKKWQKFAENEIVEYKKFIQQIKKN